MLITIDIKQSFYDIIARKAKQEGIPVEDFLVVAAIGAAQKGKRKSNDDTFWDWVREDQLESAAPDSLVKGRIYSNQLYAYYQRWCKVINKEPCSHALFSRLMVDTGIPRLRDAYGVFYYAQTTSMMLDFATGPTQQKAIVR